MVASLVPALPEHEVNRALLALFGPPPAGAAARDRDPYREAGCHPDAVARLWDELGAALPAACAFLAAGRPVLAHPEAGAIFAFALGTAYGLWLPPAARADAGASTVQRWSDGSATDLARAVGAGWVWGAWDRREPGWCRSALAWWGERR